MTTLFLHAACDRCGQPFRKELAHKTGHLCTDCFHERCVGVLESAVLHAEGELLKVKLLQSRRSLGERRRRQRRKRTEGEVSRHRQTVLANSRAEGRLRKLFPALYEVLKAQERSKLGLDPWTIDSTVTPHTGEQALQALADYYQVRGADDEDGEPRLRGGAGDDVRGAAAEPSQQG